MSVQPYTLGRDPNNFSDPLTFNPDRWDKESKEHHHPFAYLPFGYGPRACYGEITCVAECNFPLGELKVYKVVLLYCSICKGH